jgi:hypothetical protein
MHLRRGRLPAKMVEIKMQGSAVIADSDKMVVVQPGILP